ncbi:hemerythrin domain-containing protein [Streptomyces smyrnaeus]|uniref:hemerythrin domain-containing protein n=1 Tax=Streptomyces smyrnaeus TaxID=1387713 RepID=UPI0036C63DAF
MTGLLAALQEEHGAIWKLLNSLTGGAGAPEPDTTAQRHLAQQLVALQSGHEFSEELVVWPAVRRLCAHGDELVRHTLGQERALKRALNELAHISPGSQEFTDCVNTIAGHNRSHLAYEQNEVWPRLSDSMSDADAEQLARQWAATRRRAPSRPHPHLPTHPSLLGPAATAVAAFDRMCGPLTHRVTARRRDSAPRAAE